MESNWVLLDVCPFSNHIQIASVKWGALSSTNCCSLSFNSSTLPWHHPARCESTQLAGRAGEIWKQKWSSHVWLNWSQRVHYVSGHYYNISPTYRFPWHKGISLPSLPFGGEVVWGRCNLTWFFFLFLLTCDYWNLNPRVSENVSGLGPAASQSLKVFQTSFCWSPARCKMTLNQRSNHELYTSKCPMTFLYRQSIGIEVMPVCLSFHWFLPTKNLPQWPALCPGQSPSPPPPTCITSWEPQSLSFLIQS